MYSLQQITQITNSKFIGKNNYSITTFLSDSRNLLSVEGVLFVAIKTNKNNGHIYIKNLVEK